METMGAGQGHQQHVPVLPQVPPAGRPVKDHPEVGQPPQRVSSTPRSPPQEIPNIGDSNPCAGKQAAIATGELIEEEIGA